MAEAQTKPLLTRRALLQLAAIGVVGFLAGQFLRSFEPLGDDVGDKPVVQAILQERKSPMVEPAGADLTMVVFTDYGCPACRKAHPELVRAVAEDGAVRVIYKDWPIFGELSERAARVALAAEYQGLYPAAHDAFMQARSLTDPTFRAIVEREGGDWQRLLDDLDTHREEIDAALARNARQAFSLQLGGTPGYLIGPILVRGALSQAEFERVIEEARSEGGKS